MRLARLAVAGLLAFGLPEAAKANPCDVQGNAPFSQPDAIATCETVVNKRRAVSPAPQDYLTASAQDILPPPAPDYPKPDWVYIGTGVADAHIGERQIYVNGRPTNRYTSVTLITPSEQSQYNPYPVGPEIALLWKTPSLAAYGITDIGVGVAAYRSSTYTTATILGFRLGHDLAPGINAGLIAGPILSGYSEPVAVAAELEFDLKDIAAAQQWGIADVIPPGLVIKNRVMPGKAKFWEAGQGVNAAFELWAGLRVSLP